MANASFGDSYPTVAVIGAGATGYATLMALKKYDVRTILVDPWQEWLDIDLDGESSLNLKTTFGSRAMYEYPRNLVSIDSDQIAHLTATIGGLTSVWGAGLDFSTSVLQSKFSVKELEKARKSVEDLFGNNSTSRKITKRNLQLVKTYNHASTKDLELSVSDLAIDWDKCTFCGQCLTGCPTGAIWDAGTKLREIFDTKTSLSRGFAKTLEQNPDGTIKISVQNERELQQITVDRCFVACGPIASAALFQRSGLIPKTIIMDETRICYLPIIDLSKNTHNRLNFTAAQYFLKSKEGKGVNEIWMSLFESSQYIRDKAHKYLKGAERLIPNFLWNKLLVGITYLPVDLSNKLEVSFNGEKSELKYFDDLKKDRREIRDYLIDLATRLRNKFFFPLTLFRQLGEPGASFHVGVAKNLDGISCVNDNGAIRGTEKIYSVDSFSLPQLPLGPITALTMINSIATVNRAFSEVKNS